MEDLGTAAWQAAEPSLDKLLDHLLDRLPSDLAKPLDLDGRVSLDMDLGHGFLDPADHVEVIIERQLVMKAANNMQLGGPTRTRLPRSLDDLIPVHHIGPNFPKIGPKRTEIASVNAHIGRVDMRVHVVIAEVAVVPLADKVGHRSEREQVVRRFKHRPSSKLNLRPASTFSRIALNRSGPFDIAFPSSHSVWL